MGNRGARVSRVEVSPTAVRDEDVYWEDDDIDDIDEPGRTESKPASLSSKAGSILVRVRPSCSTHDRHIYIYISRDYTTYSSWYPNLLSPACRP